VEFPVRDLTVVRSYITKEKKAYLPSFVITAAALSYRKRR
jgi:hypothetical protein